MSELSKAAAELAKEGCKEFEKEFIGFVETGEAPDAYWMHLLNCEICFIPLNRAFEIATEQMSAAARKFKETAK